MSIVLFDEVTTASNHVIGVATLNSEKSLNALNLEMIELLTSQFKTWQAQDNIALIVLQGAGDKAFCAGGDVVSLYNAMASGDKENYIERFFTQEYKLDYLIHAQEKPVLVWGHGIVMGGGLGLMAGASHRVVTEKSRIAMPEITIGLYPDVGGSYFLSNMPDQVGLFLGLTGASINASDAIYTHLADYFVESQLKDELVAQLTKFEWSTDATENHESLNKLLAQLSPNSELQPPSNIKAHLALFEELSERQSLCDKVACIGQYTSDDKWITRAQASLQHGSPLSAQLVWRQLNTATGKTLKQCFEMELGLSVKCGRFGEFQEGVRALLIDKDNKPNWRYDSIELVDESVLDDFFAPIWDSETHPLN